MKRRVFSHQYYSIKDRNQCDDIIFCTMDWPAKARSKAKAKGSPSPDLIFPMSPPDSYSFPRPADTSVARAPGALVTRGRIQSAMGSAAMTPEAQVAVQEATERKYSAHPSNDPLSPFMYGRRGPPPPSTPGLSTRTTHPTRVARNSQQDSSFWGPADSHYRSQASHHSHRPSALAYGHSMKNEDNDKGKGKAVTHASHGGGDAYKAQPSKKVHKFYVNDDDDDDDDDDEDDTSDDMDKLNGKMAGLTTRYWSEGSRGTTSKVQQQYWGKLLDIPKRSPQPAHPQTRQRPSLTVQPEQHVKQHVKQQRVHSSRHASGSKKVRSSRTRPPQVHHSPVSPGYAAPTSGTHRLHALAYPYSPDDRFPHPSASEGRSAPIPVPGYQPEEPIFARSFCETDIPEYQEYMKRVGLK